MGSAGVAYSTLAGPNGEGIVEKRVFVGVCLCVGGSNV